MQRGVGHDVAQRRPAELDDCILRPAGPGCHRIVSTQNISFRPLGTQASVLLASEFTVLAIVFEILASLIPEDRLVRIEPSAVIDDVPSVPGVEVAATVAVSRPAEAGVRVVRDERLSVLVRVDRDVIVAADVRTWIAELVTADDRVVAARRVLVPVPDEVVEVVPAARSGSRGSCSTRSAPATPERLAVRSRRACGRDVRPRRTVRTGCAACCPASCGRGRRCRPCPPSRANRCHLRRSERRREAPASERRQRSGLSSESNVSKHEAGRTDRR